MKKLLNYRFLMMTVVILMLTTGTTAYAGTIRVNVNDGSCVAAPQVDPYSVVYCSIEDAISDAASGDTIKVAKGTYVNTGQVVIDRDLTIRGKGAKKTIIKPGVDTGSSGDSRGWWLVKPGVVFHLSRVTMDGSGRLVWQGIRHQGTGTIKRVKFTEIKFEESGPSYAGTAVAAFAKDPADPAGPVDITKCKFTEIGRVGVLYFSSSVNGSNFKDNRYTGKGDGDFLDYGVEVGAGAQVYIKKNKISACRGVAEVDGSTSAGILVTTFFGPGTTVTIKRNRIYKNTTGILVGFGTTDTSVVDVYRNRVFKNESNGIYIDTREPGNKVVKNYVHRNGGDGIRLVSDNSEVKYNKAYKNKGHGISINGDGNTLERNYAWKNYGNGFDVDAASSGNPFKKNKSFRNTGYGYNDESTGSGTGVDDDSSSSDDDSSSSDDDSSSSDDDSSSDDSSDDDNSTANTYVNNKCWKNVLGGSNPSGLCGPQH